MCHKVLPQIARFMGPTWGPSGADRTHVGPMLAPCTFDLGTTPSCPKLHPGTLDWIKNLECAIRYISWYWLLDMSSFFSTVLQCIEQFLKQFIIQFSCCSFCATMTYNNELHKINIRMIVWFHRHTTWFLNTWSINQSYRYLLCY